MRVSQNGLPSPTLLLQPSRVEQQLLALLTSSENGIRVLLSTDKRTGERGVTIGGQFIPATVPPFLKDGEALVVRPEIRADSILLKIIPQRIETPQSMLTSSVADELKKIFDQKTLSDLRTAIGGAQPRTSSGTITQQTSTSIITSAAVNLEDATESVILLKTAIERTETVTENTLRDSKTLANSLEKLASRPQHIPAREGHLALERLAKELPSIRLVSLAKAVSESIEKLLQLPTPITFSRTTPTPAQEIIGSAAQPRISIPQDGNPNPTSEEAIPAESGATESRAHQNRLLLTMLNYAVSSQPNPGTALRQLVTSEIRDNPLLALLMRLSQALPPETESGPHSERVLIQHMHQLSAELRKAREQGSNEKDLREVLTRGKSAISQALNNEVPSTDRIHDAAIKANILKAIESTLSAQEALTVLNPLFSALGEPALLLIPTFFSGALGKWLATFTTHHTYDSAEDGDQSTKKHEPHRTIEVGLNLPSLGEIDVRMSLRGTEIFIHAGIANDEARGFIEARLPQIESKLTPFGFTSVAISVGNRTHTINAPAWVGEVTRSWRVA